MTQGSIEHHVSRHQDISQHNDTIAGKAPPRSELCEF